MRNLNKSSLRSIYLLLFVCTIPLAAQQIRFRHLSIDNGLSQNAVLSIIQNRQGYMWFGTKDGLNRYDGYTFRVFQNDPADTISISSNYISCLFEDSRGRIWIGTLNGSLDRYEPVDEKFTRFTIPGNENRVTAIEEDYAGRLWFGTEGNGVFRFSLDSPPALPKIEHFYHSLNTGSISSNFISSIRSDLKGVVWLGTAAGLDKFDEKQNSFRHYNIETRSPDAPPYPPYNGVTAIKQLKEDTLWLGTPSGLVKFNTADGVYSFFPHHYTVFRFGWGIISDIIVDNNGGLWLATPGELMRFDPSSGQYTYITNDPLDPGSISYNSVSAIWCDRSGIIWIGTPGAGINIYDPKANRFSLLRRKTETGSRVTGFSVRAICEDNEGNIWISTDVLYRWNRKTGELKSYETSSVRPDDFGNTGAWSIAKDNSGILWFATSQGLFSYDPASEKERLYKYDPKDSSGLPEKEIDAVFVDNHGHVWIASGYYFSELVDISRGKFIHYRYNTSNTRNVAAHPAVYQDKNDIFWIGTDNGLFKFDQKLKSIDTFKNDPSNPRSLDNNYIKSICPDPRTPDKYLWIGTAGGGLNKFNKIESAFDHFTTKDGLPNNVVYGILSDLKGNLWLSTNHGLSSFNPASAVFKNFDVLDGLQSNEFNTNGFYKSKSGEMFFGGIKGLNYFHPEDVKNNPFIPNIVITSCEVQNQSSETGNHAPVIKTLTGTSEVTLSYKEDIIRIEFASLDFSAPEKNRYSYMLENFNDNWVNAGTHHSATFTHLPAGKYIFRVRGSNNDGVWNEKGASLTIIIFPPWWQTWWAFLIYGLLFLSGLYSLRKYELNRMNLKNQLKLEKVESDSLRHLDQLKTRFFANISHEFRTPLTLILGQVESVLSLDIGTKAKGKLHIANRNARRLLTLINQLLDISKIEAGSMQLKAEQHNIVSFLKSLFYSFESLADTKQITLKFESELVNIPVVFEPDKMEKVFYNLFSNAFKFTPPGGTITVKAVSSNTSAVISIKDTGSGIPANRMNKIFDRFYQMDNSSTREHEGTGIGLALTKELIELHKGTIKVKGETGEGAEFVITLPLGSLTVHKVSLDAVPHDNVFDEIITEPGNDIQDENLISGGNGEDREGEIILIVEDNADVRNYIREQLETEFIIIDARNGEAGIAKARGIVPDLIITDVMMPKMNGYRFSQEIRKDERTSHIPIIMLTAKAGLDDKIEGLETGIDAYLTKPFSTREMKVTVKNLIQQRKELRRRFSRATLIKPSEVSAVSADQVFLQKTMQLIEKHFSDDQFGVELLASEAGMSVSQMNRKLKALIDQPAGQLIRSLRLQRAAELLKQNSGTVAEICYQVGFNDQSYFSRAFKKQFGCSPSDYKKIAD